jgi:uncharacterized protein YneF (UPF0154 family)
VNLILAILLIVIALVVGVVGGFFLARKYMKNYFKENPPVNEDMIRTMMSQMGQKPKEAKVQQILRQMNSQANQKK